MTEPPPEAPLQTTGETERGSEQLFTSNNLQLSYEVEDGNTDQVVTRICLEGIDGKDVTEDILQQALSLTEANACLDPSTGDVVYSPQIVQIQNDNNEDEENTLVNIADFADSGFTINPGQILQTEDGIPVTINEHGELVIINMDDHNTVADEDATNSTNDNVENTSSSIAEATTEVVPDDSISNASISTKEEASTHVDISTNNEIGENDKSNEPTNLQQSKAENTTVVPALGSSDNPIRIIQQGNHYTSMQQLTPEQLAHIMQVLQQQQVAKTTQNSEPASATLFNPETNTRIVYRVIYPSELHNKTENVQGKHVIASSAPKPMVQRGTGRRGRPPINSIRGRGRGRGKDVVVQNIDNWEKLGLVNEDSISDTFELSREEKEKKKRDRPKTRSGRVSKPPRHMIKDYRRIHLVEWDEDYDDSDGGYSDFHESDKDKEGELDNEDNESLQSTEDITLKKRVPREKKYKCKTCDKAYSTRFHMKNHYKYNRDHGELTDEEDGDETITVGKLMNFVCETCGKGYIKEAGLARHLRMFPHHGSMKFSSSIAAGKVFSNGVNSSQPLGPRSRRKLRLKELIDQCDDEDLMEIVLPRLSKVITLWEFLLMKTEKGTPLKPNVPSIYREFESLHKQMVITCKKCFKQSNNDNKPVAKLNNVIEIKNTTIAESLGLETGLYETSDIPLSEQAFQLKCDGVPSQKTSSSLMPIYSKRKIDHELLNDINPKRPRFNIVSPKSKFSRQVKGSIPIHVSSEPDEVMKDIPVRVISASDLEDPGNAVFQQKKDITVPVRIISDTDASSIDANEIKKEIPIRIIHASDDGTRDNDVPIRIICASDGSDRDLNSQPINFPEISPTYIPDNQPSDQASVDDDVKPASDIAENVDNVASVGKNGELSMVDINESGSDRIKTNSSENILLCSDQNYNCDKKVEETFFTKNSDSVHTSAEKTGKAQSESNDLCRVLSGNEEQLPQNNESNLIIKNNKMPINKDSNDLNFGHLPEDNVAEPSVTKVSEPSIGNTPEFQQETTEVVDEIHAAGVIENVNQRADDDDSEEATTIQGHLIAPNIIQALDGTIYIQRPDGTMMQLQSSNGEEIPIETLQALVTMDPSQLQVALDQADVP